MALIPCGACGRHAKARERRCPACDVPLRQADGTIPRTAGAALLGLSAALAMPSGACGEVAEPDAGAGGAGGAGTIEPHVGPSSSSLYPGSAYAPPRTAPPPGCNILPIEGMPDCDDCLEYACCTEYDECVEGEICEPLWACVDLHCSDECRAPICDSGWVLYFGQPCAGCLGDACCDEVNACVAEEACAACFGGDAARCGDSELDEAIHACEEQRCGYPCLGIEGDGGAAGGGGGAGAGGAPGGSGGGGGAGG